VQFDDCELLKEDRATIDRKRREQRRSRRLHRDVVVSERVSAVLEAQRELVAAFGKRLGAVRVRVLEDDAVAIVRVLRERRVQRDVQVGGELDAAQPEDDAHQREEYPTTHPKDLCGDIRMIERERASTLQGFSPFTWRWTSTADSALPHRVHTVVVCRRRTRMLRAAGAFGSPLTPRGSRAIAGV